MKIYKAIAIFLTLILLTFFTVCKKSDMVSGQVIRVSALEIDAAEPAIAADANGNIYVVYVEHGADKSADVYLQKFDAKLEPDGEKRRVNPEKGKAKAWRGDPPTIKIGGNNAIYVGWTAKLANADKPSASDLNLSVSRDGGKTFAAPVKVNDDILPAAHGMHSLEIGKDNRVYMAWLDERNVKSNEQAKKPANIEDENQDSEFRFVKVHHNSNQSSSESGEHKIEGGKMDMKHEAAEPNSEIFFAVSGDGGKTFSANVKLSSEVCPCCKTNLLAAPDGKIYASWRQVLEGDFRHIAFAVSSDSGANFSKPKIVSDDKWKINACPVSGAAMTIDGENTLKIAWFTAGEAGKPGLYEAESKDSGETFSGRVLISEGEMSGTPIFSANENKNFKIVWESNGKIYQSQPDANRNFTSAEVIADGNLPVAVIIGKKIFVAFIESENERRGIRLAAF